jgi:phage shock protein A
MEPNEHPEYMPMFETESECARLRDENDSLRAEVARLSAQLDSSRQTCDEWCTRAMAAESDRAALIEQAAYYKRQAERLRERIEEAEQALRRGVVGVPAALKALRGG